MANIRENPGNSLTLEPTETGISSILTGATRVGGLYDQAGQAMSDTGRRAASALQDIGDAAVNYETQRQVSAGAPMFAKALSDLDQEWNVKVRGGKDADGNVIPPADPNDPTIRVKFMEERLPAVLDSLRDSFTTDKSAAYAESQIDQLRQHFNVKTAADMSTRARDVTKTNIDELTNTLSNAAYSDPTTAKAAIGMLQHSVGTMVAGSNMNADDASRVSTEVLFEAEKSVTRAAAAGAISVNPDAGVKEYSKPEYAKYLSGSDLHALESQARTVQSAMRTDATRTVALQKQQQQDKSDQAENQYIAKLHDDDPKVSASVTAHQISIDPTLTREAKERMIGIVERETKPEAAAKISNGTAADLITRMRLPIGDPNRIDDLGPAYKALAAGKLNKGDLKFVRDEYTAMSAPDGESLSRRQGEFVESVKPLIDKSNPMMGKIDQSGHQQLYSFTTDLQRKVAEYRAKGKDPRDLMDPSKPDYMGSPAALAPYQKTLQQSVADQGRKLTQGRGGGNLTDGGSTITGVQTIDIPADMLPADALKKYGPGATVRLPDGRTKTLKGQ